MGECIPIVLILAVASSELLLPLINILPSIPESLLLLLSLILGDSLGGILVDALGVAWRSCSVGEPIVSPFPELAVSLVLICTRCKFVPGDLLRHDHVRVSLGERLDQSLITGLLGQDT